MLQESHSILTRRNIIFLFLVALAVYGLVYYQRYSGYAFWLENREQVIVENVTAMSDHDSYYWLRVAREYDRGNLGIGKPDPLKNYPDGSMLAYRDSPSLLVVLISFGKNFTGGNYYHAGMMLIPLLAGLFVFPLFFYCYRLGFGVSAVLGGLVGAFSDAYYARTKTGRIDTDLLNLFFPLAAACFLLPIRRDRAWYQNGFLAVSSGLMIYLFNWWYQQPSFILFFLFFMALFLVVQKISWRQVPFLLVLFLVAAGPDYVQQSFRSLETFLRAYISPQPSGSIAWPNVFSTIGEIQARGLLATLAKLHGLLPLVVLGFVGLAYLCICRFRLMLPVAPMLLLGLWSLVGPNRFAMYLAPFIGVGVGVVIELAVRYGWAKTRLRHTLQPFASLALIVIVFLITSPFTKLYATPTPNIGAKPIQAILDVKKLVPRYSAMFTPYWEYGYPLMEFGEFATYIDGGTQGGFRSTLPSIAMMSPRQEDLVSFLSYVDDHGFSQLNEKIRKENLSPEQLRDLVFNYPDRFSGGDVYILYLEKMIWKMFSLSKLGTWDFDTKQSRPTDYVELHCFSMVNEVMTCADGTIDLGRGLMNDGSNDIPLRGAFFVDDGYVSRRWDYPRDDGYYLQVLMTQGKVYLILVADEPLFRSNFNQQYLLGYFDKRYFEEVYNDFPVARVLKVRQNSVGASPGNSP